MTRDPVVIIGMAFIAFMLCVVFPAGVNLAIGLDDLDGAAGWLIEAAK